MFDRCVALLVGVGKYGDDSGLGNLPSALKDVRAMEQAFRDAGFDIFRGGAYLNATSEMLHRALEQLQGALHSNGEKTLAVVYFSGHGVNTECNKQPEDWLLPSDYIGQATLSMRERRACNVTDHVVAALRPAHTAILLVDACRAFEYNTPVGHAALRKGFWRKLSLKRQDPGRTSDPCKLLAAYSCKQLARSYQNTLETGGYFTRELENVRFHHCKC